MSPGKPISPEKRKSYNARKISDFSMNVQSRRLQLGLTQSQLGEMVGIPRTRISEIEAGRFVSDPEKVWLIADALECSCDDLLRPQKKTKALKNSS